MGFRTGSHGQDSFFRGVLAEAFGEQVEILSTRPVSGGCINNATIVQTPRGQFFLKWNAHIPPDMFATEAKGLTLLADSSNIGVPDVYASGTYEGKHYLLLEFIESNVKVKTYWSDFGRALAIMHRDHTEKQHGLGYDNYIGRLYQNNTARESWSLFFIENRLEVQLQLALKKGEVDEHFAERYRSFYKRIPELLPEEPPSLLHGDLWSGNVITGPHGQACFIDPAVYYGNREIELSFTRMFGGFDQAFYAAYQDTWALEPGFEQRIDIYNMYPSMVHVNLFGGSYLGGVETVLSRYL